MPSQYLSRVNSRPMHCDDKMWEKWYTEEHIPDLVNHKLSTRAAFYREVFDVPDLYAYNKEKNPRNYLALYQTDFKDLSRSEQCKAVKMTSELSPEKEAGKSGEFDMRNYELIHDFDPNGLGDTPAPYILYAELEPEDEDDLDTFYREEHFPLLSKVPGYRRGLRYKLGPVTPLTMGKPPKFVALHEFEKSHGIKNSEEMVTVTTTPWTLKTMAGVTFAEIRSFELIKAVGY